MSATRDSTLADSEQLVADLQRQLAERIGERDEAREYQTATSEAERGCSGELKIALS
jgi:hypothetical protein